MKKLIFAAAAVAGMGAFALESANVVGYNAGSTGSDNNFATIPFASIGYNTADIQQIKLSDGGAGGIGWGSETFSVWEGVPTVAEGSAFFYYDPSADMTGTAKDYYWGDETGAKASYSIAPGQAVVINCAADIEVSTSGEVSDEKVSFTSIAENNFTGNPFPAEIDIQAIKISDGGAGGIGWGSETFSVWEGVPTVAEGSAFFYYDPPADMTGTAKDYYWGDETGAKATYPIAPGQGVVINCAAGLTVSIDAPFAL
ncbi:MAG: hypothetical protein IKJ45_14150 [Kiritimatiellae bacterium]|nr:hypothetical protein [Kiritimatiellia bacterium]